MLVCYIGLMLTVRAEVISIDVDFDSAESSSRNFTIEYNAVNKWEFTISTPPKASSSAKEHVYRQVSAQIQYPPDRKDGDSVGKVDVSIFEQFLVFLVFRHVLLFC